MLGCCRKGGCDGDVCYDAPSVGAVAAFDVLCCLYLAPLSNGYGWRASAYESEGEGFVKHPCFCTAGVASFGDVLYASVCLNRNESRAVHGLYRRN